MTSLKSNQSPDERQKSEVFCPDCEARLSLELVAFLLKGNTVYCEMCGFPFIGIVKGEVKPLERQPDQRFDTPVLSKQEKQWIRWKKVWKGIKSDFLTEIRQVSNELKQTAKEIKGEHNPSGKNKVINSTLPLEPSTKPIEQATPINQEIIIKNTSQVHKKKEKEKFNQTINPNSNFFKANFHQPNVIITSLTPLFYILIFVLTILSLVNGQSNGLGFTSAIIIEIFVIFKEMDSFNHQIKKHEIKHAGIPMIILGLFTLHAYAIGLSLLIRGILSLLDYIQNTCKTSPFHPAIRSHKLTKSIWIREVILSLSCIGGQLIILLYISEIFSLIEIFVFFNGKAFGMIWNIIMGLIIVVVVLRKLRIFEQSQNPSFYSTNHALIAIVLGVISIGMNIGIMVLFWGVLVLIFNEVIDKPAEEIPHHNDIRNIKYVLVAKDNPKLNLSQNEGSSKINKPNFDHKTGKRIIISPSQNERETHIQVHPLNKKIHFGESTQSNKDNRGKSPISSQVYTIIQPHIRARLLMLPIEEHEKDIIARSLLYLNEFQQNQYIEELESINLEQIFEKELANRINVLPISGHQRKKLINQLQYMPIEQQLEFVEFIESTTLKNH